MRVGELVGRHQVVDGLLLEHAQDPGDRDRHPVRADVQLVAQLVHRLLELEDGEQPVERLAARAGRAPGRRSRGSRRGTPRGRAPPSRRARRRRGAGSTAEAAYANERSIPATSRSGERLRRRSGSERAGSPSKSRITQSSSAQSVWPRWKSPWWRIIRPGGAGVGEHAAAARAPPRRGPRSARAPRRRPGSSRKTRSISSSIVAVSRPSASGLGSSGRSSGRPRRRRARCASRRSPRRAGAAGRGSGPGASASSSSASSQPSSAVRHELLEDAERRLQRPAAVRVPAARAAGCSGSRAR